MKKKTSKHIGEAILLAVMVAVVAGLSTWAVNYITGLGIFKGEQHSAVESSVQPESSVISEVSASESSSVESSATESSAPESSVPESSAPESAEPESSAPESSAPEEESKGYQLVEGWEPHAVEGTEPWRYLTSEHIYVNNVEVSEYQADKHIYFEDENYTDAVGLITFRGNNYRNTAVVGTIENKREIMDVDNAWTHETTGLATPDGSYWTGNGWTGQPLFREWTPEQKAIMTNMYDWAKEKDDLVEVIYASLDGYIYFMDLDSGENTRDPLFIGRVFKGAGSLDPRGYPIMYVGSGYESGEDGASMIYIINLLDGSVMWNIGWLDPYRSRWFPYFDSSALVCAETDQLIYPGENGVLYIVDLNTEYDEEAGTVSVNPDKVVKYVYYNTRGLLGMEDSAVIFQHYLYIADNGGDMLCIDLETLKCVWCQDVKDDTNDSPVFAIEEDGRAYIYISTAFRADYRYREDEYGDVPIYKIDAETGEIIWEVDYWCQTIEDLAGGVEATGYLGEGELADYFYIPMARTGGMYWGKLVAINRYTGEVAWEYEMDYSWSSPLCVYGEDGKGYVINCNFAGDVYMIDGVTGELVDKVNLGYNIEASPAVYHNRLVVGTRGCLIWGMEFK